MIVDFSTRAYPLAVRSLLRPRHCTVPAYVAHSLPKHAEQRVSTYDVPVCIQRCCCCCCCPVCCYSAAVNSCCCCLLLFTIVHLPPEVVLHAIQTAEVVVFTAKYIYIYTWYMYYERAYFTVVHPFLCSTVDLVPPRLTYIVCYNTWYLS